MLIDPIERKIDINIPFDKNNPFLASLTERRKLTHEESEKNTQHFIINIAASGMIYAPGDSLGVYPTNDPKAIGRLLAALKFSGSEEVILPKVEEFISLRNALLHRLSLANPTKKFLIWLSKRVVDPEEKSRIEDLLQPRNEDVLKDYLYNREFIDLAEEFKSAQFTPQEYTEHLKRLVPRLYSIASSPKIYPNEVHLTVAVVRYKTNEKDRIGVASTYLSDRALLKSEKIPVFIAHSHFKLPEDLSSDIIMVGPGTGVSPFRAFMQEYIASRGTGKTWLFFGERRRKYEFLYGHEWEEYCKNGHLTRFDLAFSRDQEHKVYVQHKITENAAELWIWIRNGAYFYVCGDKTMGKDVEVELMQLFQIQGDMNEYEAKDYLKKMKQEKRYQKDVY